MFFAPAWSRRRKAAHARSLGDPAHTQCQIKTPPRKGFTTEAGFCARYAASGKRQAASRKLPPRADSPLAEQARNRDHDSSDPSSQAKKQQKIAQKHRHIAPPLCLRWAILTLQGFGLRSIPDS